MKRNFPTYEAARAFAEGLREADHSLIAYAAIDDVISFPSGTEYTVTWSDLPELGKNWHPKPFEPSTYTIAPYCSATIYDRACDPLTYIKITGIDAAFKPGEMLAFAKWLTLKLDPTIQKLLDPYDLKPNRRKHDRRKVPTYGRSFFADLDDFDCGHTGTAKWQSPVDPLRPFTYETFYTLGPALSYQKTKRAYGYEAELFSNESPTHFVVAWRPRS